MAPKNNVPEEVKLDPAQTIPPTPLLLEQEKAGDLDFDDHQTKYLKNIPYAKAVDLAGLVDYAPGQVASKTLAQNSYVGIKSTGDAFVTVLEGKGKITIDDNSFELGKGQCIVMPAGHPHAVSAVDNFKMLLVVVFAA